MFTLKRLSNGCNGSHPTIRRSTNLLPPYHLKSKELPELQPDVQELWSCSTLEARIHCFIEETPFKYLFSYLLHYLDPLFQRKVK